MSLLEKRHRGPQLSIRSSTSGVGTRSSFVPKLPVRRRLRPRPDAGVRRVPGRTPQPRRTPPFRRDLRAARRPRRVAAGPAPRPVRVVAEQESWQSGTRPQTPPSPESYSACWSTTARWYGLGDRTTSPRSPRGNQGPTTAGRPRWSRSTTRATHVPIAETAFRRSLWNYWNGAGYPAPAVRCRTGTPTSLTAATDRGTDRSSWTSTTRGVITRARLNFPRPNFVPHSVRVSEDPPARRRSHDIAAVSGTSNRVSPSPAGRA